MAAKSQEEVLSVLKSLDHASVSYGFETPRKWANMSTEEKKAFLSNLMCTLQLSSGEGVFADASDLYVFGELKISAGDTIGELSFKLSPCPRKKSFEDEYTRALAKAKACASEKTKAFWSERVKNWENFSKRPVPYGFLLAGNKLRLVPS